ncbi:hypothetical protein ACLOJK_022538 [Asimina triloba]
MKIPKVVGGSELNSLSSRLPPLNSQQKRFSRLTRNFWGIFSSSSEFLSPCLQYLFRSDLGGWARIRVSILLMDAGCLHRAIAAVEVLPSAVKSGGGLNGFLNVRSVASVRAHNLPQRSAWCSGNQNFGGKLSRGDGRRGLVFVAFASAESSKCDFRSVATPLEPQSSAGKFLSDILKNHWHFFHVAAAEQLEELASERDGAVARQQHSLGSNESCLHGRIAEMKELECQIAIEEVMYMLVVQKFSVAGVPMLPRLSKCIKNGKLHILLSKDRELESVHSLDMLDMIREHLSTILLSRGKTDDTDNWTTSRICRLQLGRVYAASIMYGYFLKSASFRYSLELNFARTHQGLPSGHGVHVPPLGFRQHRHENLAVLDAPANSKSSPYHGLGRSIKPEELRSYVMQFDSETLQRCAKLKSLEAVNLIEKHTWALFGNGASQIEDDEIAITFSALKRLVLEAVAFGSFLWDVERDVDSIYRLKEN